MLNLSDELRKLAMDVQTDGLAPHLQAERIHGLAARLEAGESPVFDLILTAFKYGEATEALGAPLNSDSQLHRQERAVALLELEKAALTAYEAREEDEGEEDVSNQSE